MRYATIKWTDIANGEGVRISLFVSGCTHHCKNCFNQIAWDFNYGELFTQEVEEKIFKELSSPFIAGISLLGGEPLEPQNQIALYPFIKELKLRFPQKTVWCYTGCVLDEKRGVLTAENKNISITAHLISLFDVLVDGPFIEERKDIRLKFRGSSNQRVIDVKKTLEKKECVLYLE
jgi:anaerobic ribonucleoside-triphosphate reductase activating protein